MKKRNLIVSLMLTLALVASASASAFALNYPYKYPGHENGIPKLESVEHNNPNSQEMQVEKVALQLNKEVKEGKYTLISTEELKADIDAKKNMVIVDTMGGAWDSIHIPGAIKTWAPLYVTSASADGEKWTSAKKKALLDAVKAKVGTKTQYLNKKTNKWVDKKPAKKYIKKTREVVNKSKKVVVYCGYTGCGRSHEGAKLLVQNGYKNVVRYAGGMSAWFDAGYDYEGEYATK